MRLKTLDKFALGGRWEVKASYIHFYVLYQLNRVCYADITRLLGNTQSCHPSEYTRDY